MKKFIERIKDIFCKHTQIKEITITTIVRDGQMLACENIKVCVDCNKIID